MKAQQTNKHCHSKPSGKQGAPHYPRDGRWEEQGPRHKPTLVTSQHKLKGQYHVGSPGPLQGSLPTRRGLLTPRGGRSDGDRDPSRFLPVRNKETIRQKLNEDSNSSERKQMKFPKAIALGHGSWLCANLACVLTSALSVIGKETTQYND